MRTQVGWMLFFRRVTWDAFRTRRNSIEQQSAGLNAIRSRLASPNTSRHPWLRWSICLIANLASNARFYSCPGNHEDFEHITSSAASGPAPGAPDETFPVDCYKRFSCIRDGAIVELRGRAEARFRIAGIWGIENADQSRRRPPIGRTGQKFL